MNNVCFHLVTVPQDTIMDCSCAGNVNNHSLITAVARRDIKMMELLLKSGAEANTTSNTIHGYTEQGRTPLIIAVIKGNGYERLVELLLHTGADVNITDPYGFTALMAAAQTTEDDSYYLKRLVRLGADVNAVDRRGETALMCACSGDNPNKVKALLETGADVNMARKDGRTALINASFAGHLSIVNLLIKFGTSLNSSDIRGTTALTEALSTANIPITRVLIQSGADVDENGWNMFMLIASRGHSTCIKQCIILMEEGKVRDQWEPIGSHLERLKFIKNVSDSTTTFICKDILPDKISKFARILETSGANVNHKAESGWTALMVAALEGHIDIMRFLIESGASVNAATNSGWSPLMIAVVGDHCKCVQFLVQKGADVNVQTQGSVRKSVLRYTVEKGRVDIVKLILRCGAYIERGLIAKSKTIEKLLKVAGFFGSVRRKGEFNVQNDCRNVIRRHLLNIKPPINLVYKIRQLGLPFMVEKYLLFKVDPN